MRHLFNRFIKTGTLCLNADHLVMLLDDGTRYEGKNLNDMPDLDQQPILLVINPMQFLTANECLQHLYLTTWQQEILRELIDSSYVLRSVLFLPSLLTEVKKSEQSTLINLSTQQYLYIRKETVVLWTHLKNNQNQAQQLQEIGLYLRRYQVDFDIEQVIENLSQSTLLDPELQIKAGQKATLNIQNNDFPLIEKLVEKQRQNKRYIAAILGLLSLIGGSIIAGFCFLWLGVQAFISHNPWDLQHSVKSLTTEEREKLLHFKSFLAFQSRYPAFSLSALQSLFQKFAGKIVATDLVWQQGKWTIAFVINPAFAAEKPQIHQWCTQNLISSKLTESETTAHQYTLQFE